MQFSLLPDNVFLQIFDFLPFEDSVRVGRVSKVFRRFSQIAISRTKSLDLTEALFKNLTVNGFSVILDLCAANLKRIKIDGLRKTRLVMVLSDYACPRLLELDVGFTSVENEAFGRLIRNNPNLQRLVWIFDIENDDLPEPTYHVQYPDIANGNLETLDTGYCNDLSLQSLTGHCPNLKRLKMATNDITAGAIDDFFAHIPNVENVNLDMINNDIAFEDLSHFWNLPLTSLTMNYRNDNLGDAVLEKISASFPHLRALDLWCWEVTNGGIASLKSLKQLQSLHLDLHGVSETDEGLRELVECKQLQELVLILSFVSSTTLIALVRSCPELTKIEFNGVDDVNNSETAALFLESLSGLPKRDLTIAFHSMTDRAEAIKKSIWETEQVKRVLQQLAENEGITIKVEWMGNVNY